MKTITLISIAIGISILLLTTSTAPSQKLGKDSPLGIENRSFSQKPLLPAQVFERPASKRKIKVCPSGCAYSSIREAIIKASHGDEIIVAPGLYEEHPSVLDKTSTDGSWLTIRSEVPFEAKIVNNNRYHVFEIVRSNNIWFEGFDISSQPYWAENTQNNFGIFVNTSTDIRIVNNFVHHVGCSGIQANDGDNYALIGNVISTLTRNDFCSGISLWQNKINNPQPIFKAGEINTAYDVHFYIANNVIIDAVQLYRKGKFLEDISDGNGIILDHHVGHEGQSNLPPHKRTSHNAHYLVENNLVGFCGLRGYHSLTPNGHFRNNLSAWSSRTPSDATVASTTRAEFAVGKDGTTLCGNIGIARYEHENGDKNPNVGLGFFGYGADNAPVGLKITDNVMFVHGTSLYNRSRLSLEEKTGTSFNGWSYDSWRDPANGKRIWNKADRLAKISQAENNYFGQDPGIKPELLLPLMRFGENSHLENGKNNPAESQLSYDPYQILGEFYLAMASLNSFEVNRCEAPIWDLFGNKRKPQSIAGPFSRKGLKYLIKQSK